MIIRGAAALVIAIGVAVWLGWILNLPILTSMLAGLSPMKPNTSAGFILAGLALWFIRPDKTHPRLIWVSRSCASLVTAIGALTFIEYLLSWNMGIDGMLCPWCDGLASLPYHGRMSPATAGNFVLIGAALLLATTRDRAAHQLAQGLAFIAGAIALLTLVGYASDMHALYRFELTSFVALPTVIAFLVLVAGALCALADVGLMALLTSDTVGGMMARQLLPVAIIAPIGLAWLERLVDRLDLFPADVVEAMFTVLNIVVFVTLIGASIAEISRKDDQRRRAQEALRQSEEWLRAIIDNATGIIWVKDLDGRFLVANRYVEDVVGVPLSHMVGRTVFDLFSPAEAEQYAHNDRQVLETGRTAEFEETMMLPDGLHTYVAVKFPLRDSSGRIYALGAICTDFTQRKNTEAALRASENQLRLITDSLPSLISYVDADRRYRFTNRAYELWFGLSRGDIYGKHLEQVLGTSAYANIVSYIDAVLSGQPVSYETTMQYQYGGTRHVRSICVPDVGPDGRVYGYFALVSDITESKRAEEALRASQARLAEAMEVAQMAHWEYDVIEDVFTFNDSFYALYRTTAEREGGYSMSSARYAQRFVHPDDVPLVGIEIGKVLASTGRDYQSQVDHRIIAGDGEIRHMAVRMQLLARDDQGRITRTRGVNQDITQRKNTEEQVRTLNAELEQRVIERTARLKAANEEMEAFTYSVSHDLRAPLRAIDGFSRIVVEEYSHKLDADGNRLLGIIRTNAQRMDRLITDLLALSRVTRSDLAVAGLDMTALVNSVYQELAQSEEPASITLVVAPLHEAYGDPTLIRQVWVNLLSNAIKYTRPMANRQIEVSSLKREGMLVYAVKDNGVGFDPAYAHKLFGMFQRLHRVSDFEGTGVGLAIVQRIILRHRGQVWAEGQVNEGATFYFSLPARTSP